MFENLIYYLTHKAEEKQRKKEYYREVKRITESQELETLPGYELRGKTGDYGAYHLDHIVSIDEGFRSQIPPEIIGHISNLQFIPWKENIRKGNR